MSVRSAVRGLAILTAGAALALGAAVLISPALRQRVLARRAEPEPQQPTHIVLPDRVPASRWEGLDEAIEEGRDVGSGDVALTGA